MKTMFRVLAALGLVLLLTVFAAAYDSETEAEAADDPAVIFQDPDDSWAHRTDAPEDWEGSFELINCGETDAEAVQHGSYMDMSFRIEATQWSSYQISTGTGSEDLHLDCACYAFDSFGENTTVRVRMYFTEEDSQRGFRYCVEILNGEGLCCAKSFGEEDPDAVSTSFCLRFEAFPADEESTPDTSDADSAHQTSREWIYYSSDGRPLWQVELSGIFDENGLCTDAAGTVTITDDAWYCTEERYYAEGDHAVAELTVCRYTLGIPVGEKHYQFLLQLKSE